MSRHRKTRLFTSNWAKMSARFYQGIGKLVLFLLILMALLGALFHKYQQEISIIIENLTPFDRISKRQKIEFIETIAPIAQQLQEQYGVLASISIAQAALESEYGYSELAADYNNLYGVKTDSQDVQGIDFVTAEYVDDEWIEIVDRFKVYDSWEDSMIQHAELIYYGTSWNANQYLEVLNQENYQQQAKGLQSSGYATDPDYAEKLIYLINEWNLDQYDQSIQE